MENKGFKNAPSVKEFSVGMRFTDNNVTYKVIYLRDDEYHAAICMPDGSCVPHVVEQSRVPYSTIDLSVPWVGRKYAYKLGSNVATIISINNGYIGYDYTALKYITDNAMFLDYFTPIPIAPPKPNVKEGDIVCVKHGNLSYWGKVTLVGNLQLYIRTVLEGKDQNIGVNEDTVYHFDLDQIEITKMVPVQETK